MTSVPIPKQIDWTAEATLFRCEDGTDWRGVLCGQLHALVQAINAAHDDPWNFYIQTVDGAQFVGNEIRLLARDATRPLPDSER